MTGDDDDVPIRVDFRDPATVRAWIEDTRIKRLYRPRFFAAFCAALASHPKLCVLELGSLPPHRGTGGIPPTCDRPICQ